MSDSGKHGGDAACQALQAQVDMLLEMNAELLIELGILSDRVMIAEELLVESKTLKRGQIDAYVPSGQFADTLAQMRDALAEKVLGKTIT